RLEARAGTGGRCVIDDDLSPRCDTQNSLNTKQHVSLFWTQRSAAVHGDLAHLADEGRRKANECQPVRDVAQPDAAERDQPNLLTAAGRGIGQRFAGTRQGPAYRGRTRGVLTDYIYCFNYILIFILYPVYNSARFICFDDGILPISFQ